jgi:hypothetical protein
MEAKRCPLAPAVRRKWATSPVVQPAVVGIVTRVMAEEVAVEALTSHEAYARLRSTVAVARRIVETAEPLWLRIGGYWYPRGGIPIDVFWQSGAPPEGLWVPDQGVAGYRGRG